MFKRLEKWIEKALTKVEYVQSGKTKKLQRIEIPPSRMLVFGVQFCFIALIVLGAIEIVYIVVMHDFNEAVFSTMSGIIGTILGILIK